MDILYTKCILIREDPTKIVDKGFMMSLFDEITDHIPEYKDFNKHIYKEKKSLFIARIGSKVVLFQLLRDKLFNPQDKDNKATNNLMPELETITATAIIDNFKHK